MNPDACPSFLELSILKLLIFGGKGGVGKTTCAAAAAIAISQRRPDAQIVLVSTDPAHSLADAINGDDVPTNLSLLELSADDEHESFIAEYGRHLRTIVERGTLVDGEDIDEVINLSVPGVDELMAYMRISRWLQEARYDLVIVDSAPSGHTRNLLQMGVLMTQWVNAMDAMMAKHRYMQALYAKRGATKNDPEEQFIAALRTRIERMTALLRQPDRCRFVPVWVPEPMIVAETVDLIGELDHLGVCAPDLLVNRVLEIGDPVVPNSALDGQQRVLAAIPDAILRRANWALPEVSIEPRGCERLRTLFAAIKPLPRQTTGAAKIELDGAIPRTMGVLRVPAPSSNSQLIFVAGKGGTGKTTVACAMALALANQGHRCLLVSTDPAHSVGDCLRVDLDNSVRTVADRLDAVEIDAQGEFQTMKAFYQDEVAAALEQMLDSSIAFEGDAVRRMLDLAPPGLDECMALVQVHELLKAKREDRSTRYQYVIVDTAPSGHFLRLMGLPELISQWLRCLLAMFEKYKRVILLPELESRLLRIARAIDQLGGYFVDPQRCQVNVVAIPTEMAYMECVDLLAALEQAHIHTANLVLNMCDFNKAGMAGSPESEIAARYAEAFQGVNLMAIERAGGLGGLSTLATLGAKLRE